MGFCNDGWNPLQPVGNQIKIDKGNVKGNVKSKEFESGVVDESESNKRRSYADVVKGRWDLYMLLKLYSFMQMSVEGYEHWRRKDIHVEYVDTEIYEGKINEWFIR